MESPRVSQYALRTTSHHLPSSPFTGRPFRFRFYFGPRDETTRLELIGGTLPAGIEFKGDRFEGVPTETGQFHLKVSVQHGGETRQGLYSVRVHGHNLAVIQLYISEKAFVAAQDPTSGQRG